MAEYSNTYLRVRVANQEISQLNTNETLLEGPSKGMALEVVDYRTRISYYKSSDMTTE